MRHSNTNLFVVPLIVALLTSSLYIITSNSQTEFNRNFVESVRK